MGFGEIRDRTGIPVGIGLSEGEFSVCIVGVATFLSREVDANDLGSLRDIGERT